MKEPIRVDMRDLTGGDCWRCCIAGLTGIAYEDVPDFTEVDQDVWLSDCAAWLLERGYALVALAGIGTEYRVDNIVESPQFAILMGDTDRGEAMHACIGQYGDVWHDPHPSRAGLSSVVAMFWVMPR